MPEGRPASEAVSGFSFLKKLPIAAALACRRSGMPPFSSQFAVTNERAGLYMFVGIPKS
jgi:hypothetical protein